jgi:hypothetical protein
MRPIWAEAAIQDDVQRLGLLLADRRATTLLSDMWYGLTPLGLAIQHRRKCSATLAHPDDYCCDQRRLGNHGATRGPFTALGYASYCSAPPSLLSSLLASGATADLVFLDDRRVWTLPLYAHERKRGAEWAVVRRHGCFSVTFSNGCYNT